MDSQSDLLLSQSVKMPTKRAFAGQVIVDDSVYIVGGCDTSGQPLNTFEQMVFTSNKFKRLASMPTCRAAMATTTVGRLVVTIGGVSTCQAPSDAVEVYDISAETWSKRHPLPAPLLGVSAANRGE